MATPKPVPKLKGRVKREIKLKLTASTTPPPKGWPIKRKTNLRKQLFAEYYLAGFNGSAAAKAAGYTPSACGKRAHHLLKDEVVIKMIEERMTEIMEKLGCTQEWRVKKLMDCIDACENGRANKDQVYHPNGVISAIAEINKMDGAYAPEKRETKIDGQVGVSELVKKYERDL